MTKHVMRTAIIGTNQVVFSVWEPSSYMGGHSSLHSIDGRVHGQVGSRRLTPELNALKPGSEERIKAVQDFQVAQYEEAYEAIIAEYPEAANGKRSSGEISIRV